MLRSPTHLVGHGPTSHATSTTNSGNSSPLHRNNHHHIGQNGSSNKSGIIYQNGGARTSATNKHNINNNNNNNNSSNISNNHATKSTSTTSSNTSSPTHNSHPTTTTSSTQQSSTNTTTTTTRTSLFDSCHRKIRLIGGGPVAFLGGLVAKARRKERDGDQNSTDTKLYLEESVLERKLPDADLKALVDLPAGLDYNEWLASHTLALFEHVNLVYGTISEFCTPSGCPDMTGPGNRTYLWFDEKGKKTRVAAPQYIDYVMTFTQKTVSDESIFPTKYAKEFPSSFESIARKILRLQFHVIAHLYAAHFREIALLGLHTHLNLTFAHLTALHRRFNLIDEKETDVLRDLEIALRLTDDSASATSTATTTNSSSSCSNNELTTNSGGFPVSGVAVIGVASDECSNSDSIGSRRIDGDATVKPICTQPESMKALSNNDIGGGGGGAIIGCGGTNNIILGGGILGGFTSNDLIDTTMSSATTTTSSSSSNNLNFNNNHTHHQHNNSNLLQCSSTPPPSTTTTTA